MCVHIGVNVKMPKHKIICGETTKVLQKMEKESVDMVLTSPPYWGLRDYQMDEQLGLEPTLAEYHVKLLKITAELKRVLKPTGVVFWVHNDSYGGSGNASGHTEETTNCGKKTSEYGATKGHTVGYKPKCMLMQNERLIIKMIDEQGWILRNRIVWHKTNNMPSSVQDRFTNKYEPVYMLTKNLKYWFDLDAVREPLKESSLKRNEYVWNSKQRTRDPSETRGADKRNKGELFNMAGKNPGDIWAINTQPFPKAHFATFPEKLCEKPILCACPAEVCPECGFARVRIVETKSFITRPTTGRDTQKQKQHPECGAGLSRTGGHVAAKYNTIGWTSCDCNAEYEQGIVLDPFGGSGTVAIVAEQLCRSSILIDLNPVFCEMTYEWLHPLVSQTKWGVEQSTIEKVGF